MSAETFIVVGVDESESSHRALAWAAAEAVRRGAALRVVTAWSWDAVEGAPLAAVDPEHLLALAAQTQRDAVDRFVTPMDPAPRYECHVVQSAAADALVEASHGAELVVVGSHGRGPVRAFLLGSVGLTVIKHAACPVVVMPTTNPVNGHHRPLAGAGH